MGRPIVYCGICGKSLKDEDFAKGRAHVVDNASFCVTCRIVPEPLQAPPRPQPLPTSTPKPSPAPRPMPSSTPRHHTASPAPPPPSSGVTIGVIVAILVGVVVLAVILMNSGGRTPPPPPPPEPPPRRTTEPPRPPDEALRTAIQNLEAFASGSADPDAVLERVQSTRSTLHHTPYQSRLEAVEARALEARAARDRDRQVTALLDNVRKMRDLDPKFERREEMVKLLQGALSAAGPRKAEVEKALADYQKAADEFAAKPPVVPVDPPRPASPARLGPYELDATGAVPTWLVLGPFPNRKDRDGIYDADLLNTEIDHTPASGQEVMTRQGKVVTWTPVRAADGMIAFRSVEAIAAGLKADEPGIAYAACWVNLETAAEVKFRFSLDQGCRVWLDHKLLWHLSKGEGMGKEEVVRQTLSAGPHLVLAKVGTTGPDFAFRLKILSLSAERVPGVSVWGQPPVPRKVLYSEKFNQGPGTWVDGEVVPGGIDGTTAMAVSHHAARLNGALPDIAGPDWTLRIKMKPLVELKFVEITIWSNKSRANFRYHVRGLKTNQWNLLEVKAPQLNQKWEGGGKTFEGETVNDLRVYFDDKAPDGSLLIDDVEISE